MYLKIYGIEPKGAGGGGAGEINHFTARDTKHASSRIIQEHAVAYIDLIHTAVKLTISEDKMQKFVI